VRAGYGATHLHARMRRGQPRSKPGHQAPVQNHTVVTAALQGETHDGCQACMPCEPRCTAPLKDFVGWTGLEGLSSGRHTSQRADVRHRYDGLVVGTRSRGALQGSLRIEISGVRIAHVRRDACAGGTLRTNRCACRVWIDGRWARAVMRGPLPGTRVSASWGWSSGLHGRCVAGCSQATVASHA
jgi:hypothetical protein